MDFLRKLYLFGDAEQRAGAEKAIDDRFRLMASVTSRAGPHGPRPAAPACRNLDIGLRDSRTPSASEDGQAVAAPSEPVLGTALDELR
jgi:hypothetical protein